MVVCIGDDDPVQAVYRYAHWPKKLAIAGALGAELKEKVARGIEHLDAMVI
jgi:hypothetical protein